MPWILASSCFFMYFCMSILILSGTHVSKDMMEHRFGRESVLDGITSLRSLMSKLLAFAHVGTFFLISIFLGTTVLNYVGWTMPPITLEV